MQKKRVMNFKGTFNLKMSKSDFYKLSSFINSEYGMKMPEAKRIMLQSRLHKRLRELELTSFGDYCEYVFSEQGRRNNEIINMINEVSTNKTEFFREPAHYDYLTEIVIPEIIRNSRTNKQIKIWSVGCSSGEEPYTIAMIMSEFTEIKPDYDYSIYATDISTRMLDKAVNAIYRMERIESIPIILKKKYLLKNKDKTQKIVRIVPAIRSKIKFERLNLMDPEYNTKTSFDIIFCRNVLIYFESKIQEVVINKLCVKLKPDGFLFLGHSESTMNMNVPVKQLKPAFYRKNHN